MKTQGLARDDDDNDGASDKCLSLHYTQARRGEYNTGHAN